MIMAHDILLLDSSIKKYISLPAWYAKEWDLYCTVRHGKYDFQNNMVPVGIRGITRNQRFALTAPTSLIKKVIHPFELIQNNSFREVTIKNYDVYKMYRNAQKFFSNRENIIWGVGGSLGFELATNRPTITPNSDFDLLIYVNKQFEISSLTTDLNCNLLKSFDTQIITKKGGFSLLEYINHPKEKILLRTNYGPILTKEIW